MGGKRTLLQTQNQNLVKLRAIIHFSLLGENEKHLGYHNAFEKGPQCGQAWVCCLSCRFAPMGGLAGAWTPADHWEASVALLFCSLDSHTSILSPLLLFFFLILVFKFMLFCYVLCISVSHFKLCLEQCINKYLLN